MSSVFRGRGITNKEQGTLNHEVLLSLFEIEQEVGRVSLLSFHCQDNVAKATCAEIYCRWLKPTAIKNDIYNGFSYILRKQNRMIPYK